MHIRNFTNLFYLKNGILGQVISTFPDFKDTWFMKKLIQEEVSKIKFNINWQNDKRFSIKKRKGEEFVSRRRTINKNL